MRKIILLLFVVTFTQPQSSIMNDPLFLKLVGIIFGTGTSESELKKSFLGILNEDSTKERLANMSIDPILVRSLVKSTNFTKLFTETVNIREIFKGIASKDKYQLFIDNVNWDIVYETIDLQMFFDQPNVTTIIGKSLNISGNLIDSILANTNMKRLYKAMKVKKLIGIYLTSNGTDQEKYLAMVNVLNTDEIMASINLEELLNGNPNVLKALGVDGTALQMVNIIGVDTIIRSIDIKQYLTLYIVANGSSIDVTTLLQQAVKWDTFIDYFLGSNITVACKQGFTNMLLPLPDLSNLDPTSADTILKLNHPILQLFDSWDKIPVRVLMGKKDWLGAVDQCSKITNSKYCLANMDVGNFVNAKCRARRGIQRGTIKYTEKINSKKDYMTSFMIQGSYGFCLPKTCTEHDGQLLLESISKSALGNMISIPRRSWPPNRQDPVKCKKYIPFENGFYITLAITLVFVALSVLGTLVDEVGKFMERKRREGKNDEIIKEKPKSMLTQMLVCFSFTRNTASILSTDVPRGAILPINGIRTISLTWIMVGHTFAMLQGSPVDNLLYLKDALVPSNFTLVIMNAYPSVDTFFLLSGLLLAYLSLKKMDKTGGKLNVLMFYLHRFLRVTPLLMYLILVRANIFTAINERSPMGLLRDESGTRKSCQRYWWTNLLYINNFFPKSFWQSCTSTTWYLANDMQFYIVSPVFLYSIYFLEKRLSKSKLRHYSALIVVMIGCFVCVLINLGLIIHNNYPVMHAAYQMRIKGNPRGNPRMDPQDELYDKPYTRITPYLIGILIGYMFSRNLNMEFKRKQFVNVILWIAALVAGYYIVYGPSQMYKKNPVFLTDAQNASFGSLHILGWSLAVGWVIYSCHYKMGGIVNDFLSWKVWIPLSRLTYCAYLIHTDVGGYLLFAPHNGYHLQITAFVFHFISISTTTFLLAFVISVLVEVPIMKLEKLLFV